MNIQPWPHNQLALSNRLFRVVKYIDDPIASKRIARNASKLGSIIDREDKFGHTLLSWAVAKDKYICVHHLINSGADVNRPIWRTPLMFAAFSGNQRMIDFLITNGASRSAVNYCNQTALDIAIEAELFHIIV